IKIYVLDDFEALKRRQGGSHQGAVPTLQDRSSGCTRLQELRPGQSGTEPESLCASAAPCNPDPKVAPHRTFPVGTVLDPRTTRAVTVGTIDPVTGLMPSANGFVRDPFMGPGSTCPVLGTAVYSLAACNLNILDPT